MKKYKVTFLILQYGDYKLIVKCIQCLLHLDSVEDCRIVVVDNGTNSKKRVLAELGSPRLDIIYLELKSNIGFSKGNNYGWSFCRKDAVQDFIIVMNNDVFIYQKNFISLLYRLYEEQDFYVAGPDVFCSRKYIHTNPMSLELYNGEMALNYINSNDSYFKEYLKELGWPYMLYKKTFRKLKSENTDMYNKRHENALLHGCCLIFSYKFILLNKKAFVPETFLYGEENYLQLRCYRNGWNTLYFPELAVEHYDSGSSRMKISSYQDFKKKRGQQLTMKKHAMLEYIKYLQEETNE